MENIRNRYKGLPDTTGREIIKSADPQQPRRKPADTRTNRNTRGAICPTHKDYTMRGREMIIRFWQRDKEEIKAIITPLIEEDRRLIDELLNLPEDHFTIIDGAAEPTSKEAIELVQRGNECRRKIWKASEDLYTSIEDRRFSSLKSKKAIINNAHAQTDAIIEHFIKAMKLAEHNIKDPLKFSNDIAPLTRIWNANIFRNIKASGGNVANLDAQQIIDLIKKDLHRHYSKLDTQSAEDLTRYIEQAVSNALNTNPEMPNNLYMMVTKDPIYFSLTTAVARRKKYKNTYIADDTGRLYQTIKVGNVKYSMLDDLAKEFSVLFVALYLKIDEEFTRHSNSEYRTVSFSTTPFLEMMGVDTSNKTSVKTAIDRIRSGELRLLHTITISIDAKDKDGDPDLIDISQIEATRINKNRITAVLTPTYAEYKAQIHQVGYIPKKYLSTKGTSTNELSIKFKLFDNATQKRNLRTGQGKIISVRSLLKVTSLPTIEELEKTKKRSRWSERIKDRLEEMLNSIQRSGDITSWDYCKAKSQPLTPQERALSERYFEEWEALYINYDIPDEEIKQIILNSKKK